MKLEDLFAFIWAIMMISIIGAYLWMRSAI